MGSASKPRSTCPARPAVRCRRPPGARHLNLLEQECENATGPYSYTNGSGYSSVLRKGWHRSPKHPAATGGCGIAIIPPEYWTVGDNINLAVGQGDVQVTPLQLGVVYAALENGGTIVRPHLGVDIESPDGTVLQQALAARPHGTSTSTPSTCSDPGRACTPRPRSREALHTT